LKVSPAFIQTYAPILYRQTFRQWGSNPNDQQTHQELTMSSSHAHPKNPKAKLSRENIEILCIFAAIGDQSCLVYDLVKRLGLSLVHAPAITAVLDLLVSRGWFDYHHGHIQVTPEGTKWQKEQLSQIAERA
jgi:hypothetical protein